MKKTLALPLAALLLSCTSKPSYKKMVETTYNFNKLAVNFVMSSDTVKTDYIEIEKQGKIFIFDNKSDFIFKVSKNPNQIEIVKSNGEGFKWIEERGFKITHKKARDTLIVHFFPSDSTPASIVKFGTEYKFFN